MLELATCDSDEYFKKEDESYLFGKVYMGTTTAEVHARCAFRYHLRLSEPWTLDVKDNICIVRPPPYRPTLPVAIRTDMTTKSASSGWARFDKHEQMAGLEASMTPELEKRAYDDRHMGAVREHCRQSVGEFVKNWLMREDHWKKERFTAIVVEFPDEVGRGAKHRPNEFAPVIKLIQ